MQGSHNIIILTVFNCQINRFFYVPRVAARNNQAFLCDRPRTNLLVKSPTPVMCLNFNRICGDVDINVDAQTELLRICRQSLDTDVVTRDLFM